jgi:hypothetical protein
LRHFRGLACPHRRGPQIWPLPPYARAEWFYDTRFDTWSRQRYQLGVEIELDKTWRIEPYYAFDKNSHPVVGQVNRLGLVLKYFR